MCGWAGSPTSAAIAAARASGVSTKVYDGTAGAAVAAGTLTSAGGKACQPRQGTGRASDWMPGYGMDGRLGKGQGTQRHTYWPPSVGWHDLDVQQQRRLQRQGVARGNHRMVPNNLHCEKARGTLREQRVRLVGKPRLSLGKKTPMNVAVTSDPDTSTQARR